MPGELRNLGDIRTELQDMLNVTSGVADQDFTSNQLDKAIQRAYNREVRKAQQQGSREWFKGQATFTWPTGVVTLALPTALQSKDIILIQDATDSNPGFELIFSSKGMSGDIFFTDSNTLQWSTSGPGSDRTLVATFYALAEHLDSDQKEPTLIPVQFRDILLWSAGVELRAWADETAPQLWREMLDDLRMDYWKMISKGRPSLTGQATVEHVRPDTEPGFVY